MTRKLLFLVIFFFPFALTAQTFNPLAHNGSGCTGPGASTVGCNAATTALTTDPAHTNAITQTPVPAPANYSLLPHKNRLYPGATTRILAHYQPWFCNSSSPCNSHLNIGMDESNASQVAAQLAAMKASGIDAVDIDYYGDDASKAFNLSVTNAVNTAIAGNPAGYPKLMLTLDQGAIQPFCPNGAGINDAQMEACIENRLDYMASHYLYQSYYETFGGKPVVPFFIDTTNWPSVVWNNVWPHVHAHVALGQSCGGGCTYTAQVLILSRNSGAFTQTGLDGSFAWSQASTFDNLPAGSQLNWNGLAGYYDNFYSVARANPSKLAIGFIGKGFDDSNASFGTNKVTSQQCGQVMDLTAAKIGAAGYSSSSQIPYVQVQWNDYEEGTEIETGIDPCYTINGTIIGTTLSWVLTPTDATYASLSTLDHMEVLYGADGTSMQVGVTGIPVALTGSVDISFLPSSSTFRVRAVGKPAIINPTSVTMAEPVVIGTGTVAVTGTLQSGSTSGVKGNSFVRFRLRNFAGFVPRVSGDGILVQTQFDVKPTDTEGNFSTNLYSNDVITPNNCNPNSATACTWWTVEYWIDGKATSSGNYCIPNTPTFDLNSAVPCTTPPLPPAPFDFSHIITQAYQTVENGAIPLPKRSIINFASGCSDDSVNQRTNCTFSGGGGGGDVFQAPIGAQTITQPTLTSFNTNVHEQTRYADQFAWVQSPSGTISIGANVVTINAVRGVAAASVTPFKHYLWVAATGTPERVLITATTCTGLSSGTCTVTFTAAGTHAAGFTLGTATAGVQEAFVDAYPTDSTHNPILGAHVLLSPTSDLTQIAVFNAPLNMNWAHGSSSPNILDGQGASIRCNTSGMACVEYGDSLSSGVNSFPRLGAIRNVNFAPLAGIGHTDNGSTVVIHDHGQELTIDHVGFAFINSTDVFDYLIKVDDDEKFTLQDSTFNSGNGPPLRCTTAWCGVGLFGTTLNSGAVGYAIHNDMSMQCLGNAVDWQSGNTFSIRDSVVQAYNQWGIRALGAFDVNTAAELNNVYQEVGSCTNPLGTGTAGIICQGGRCVKTGGVGPTGKYPTLTASSSGSTQFWYYIVPKSSTLGTGAPLLLGKCLSSGAGTCTVKWYAIGSTGTITYDVIRIVGDGSQSGPYTANCGGGSVSACGSVALAQAQGTVCSGGTCTITDDITVNTTSYTVAAAAYFPKIDQWSTDVVLGPSSDTNNVHNGGTEYITDFWGGSNNSAASTAGANGPTVIAQSCATGMATGSAVMSCQTGDPSLAGAVGTSSITPEIHYNGAAINAKGLWLGTLGNVGSLAATDIITVLDSNFAKTAAGGSLRPLADAADSAIGLDNSSVLTPANSFLGLRGAAGIDFQINHLFDGTNWVERIAAALHTFKIPITTNSQITSTLGTGTAPFVVTSTTPVANLTTVPTTYNHSGTQQTGVHIVIDTCTLGTSCSVTLTGSAVFTNSSSYSCTAIDTTAANAVKFVASSGSAFALTGTGTDVLLYQCIGN